MDAGAWNERDDKQELLWLAQNGWDVTAVDVSDVEVSSHDVRNLAECCGGPQDLALLQTPEQLAGALIGLTAERAGRTRRSALVEGGVAYTVDAVVPASAPSLARDARQSSWSRP